MTVLHAPEYSDIFTRWAQGGDDQERIQARVSELDAYLEQVRESEEAAGLEPEWRTGAVLEVVALGDPPSSSSPLDEMIAAGVPAEHAAALLERDARVAGDPLYIDVAAILSGDLRSPLPTLGVRSDGEPFVYPAAVNVIFGQPESGKTLALSAIAADVLFDGGSVLWIDVDHNGAPATINRFRSFGVPVEVLGNRDRFRLALPEDKDELLSVVRDARKWKPTLAALDSVGEVLPMFGASSNSDDEYTAVHRAVLSAMSTAGIAVVAVDHEAKGQGSRDFGASGAVAKKRAVDGVMLRASIRQPFAPGSTGKAALTIVKDRHGGVRAISPSAGEREPLAAMFELSSGEATNWKFWAPDGATKPVRATASDVEALLALSPAPKSVYDVKKRLKWGSTRATEAFTLFTARNATERSQNVPGTFPNLPSPVPKREEARNVPTVPDPIEGRGTGTGTV